MLKYKADYLETIKKLPLGRVGLSEINVII